MAEEKAALKERALEDKARAEGGLADAIAAIKEMLAELFRGESQQCYRANLMLWEGQRLKIFWSTANMRAYVDRDKSPTMGWGIAGRVLLRATTKGEGGGFGVMYASGEQLSPEALRREWGFGDRDIEDTKHILWIVSAPVFVDLGGGDAEVYGVLNIDGVERPLNDPTLPYSRTMLGLSGLVARAVATYVKEGGLVKEPLRPR